MILSYHLNDAQTADAARSLCEAGSNLHVIFLAYEARDKVVLAAIDAGAGAVLDTSASTAEMIYAISIPAQGETMISVETMGRS